MFTKKKCVAELEKKDLELNRLRRLIEGKNEMIAIYEKYSAQAVQKIEMLEQELEELKDKA